MMCLPLFAEYAGPFTRVALLPLPDKSVQVVPLPLYEEVFPASKWMTSPSVETIAVAEGAMPVRESEIKAATTPTLKNLLTG